MHYELHIGMTIISTTVYTDAKHLKLLGNNT